MASRPMLTSSSAPRQPVDSRHQAMNEACRLYMQHEKIEPGAAVMAPTKPANTKTNAPVMLDTNVYGIEVCKTTIIHCYDVDMSTTLGNGKKLVLTKQGRDDFVVLDRHKRCVDIYKKMLEDNEDFFKLKDGNHLIYDGQKLLYSFKDLFSVETTPKRRTISMEAPRMRAFGSLQKVDVTIATSVRSVIEFSQKNLANMTTSSDLSMIDRSLAQFLELVLNQNCVMDSSRFGCLENGKVFILEPKHESGFKPQDCMEIGDGKQVLPGIKKSVAFIEGPQGRGHSHPSLVVDAMKSVFHMPQTLYEKCQAIANLRDQEMLQGYNLGACAKVIKGLDCYSGYTLRTRHLTIQGIHHSSAAKTKFRLEDGDSITVEDYPHFNLAICKEGTRKNYYPMEVLLISGNQRVTTNQQTASQGRNSTKQCTLVPEDRRRLIDAGVAAIDIGQTNPLLEALQIKLFDSLQVQGQQLPGVQLKYQNCSVFANQGKWKNPKDCFVFPGKIPSLWALYAISNGRSRFNQQELRKFGNMFVNEAKGRGMDFPIPAECKMISYDEAEQMIDYAADNGCDYILFVTDDNITDLHAMYKYKERKHEMTIQDCRLRTAENIINMKKLALENIIAKTNVKLGGLNYVVNSPLMLEKQLIVGIGLSAMTADMGKLSEGMKALNPISIGYTSNARHRDMFTGDFLLAQDGPGIFISVEQIITTVLNSYQRYRNTNPQRLIVYRSGASEGNYAAILENEIPLVRHAMRKLEIDAKLIYIIVRKDHAQRFFKAERNGSSSSGYGSSHGSGYGSTSEQNIPAGIVIDSEVTNPDHKMFFLNSHTTIQGSTKTPSYTVVVDDVRAPMDVLEELTYHLCHHHQIVALTTSLPAPLYIANEYAKRGRMLWMETVKRMSLEGPESEQLADMNYYLTYGRSRFADKRINA